VLQEFDHVTEALLGSGAYLESSFDKAFGNASAVIKDKFAAQAVYVSVGLPPQGVAQLMYTHSQQTYLAWAETAKTAGLAVMHSTLVAVAHKLQKPAGSVNTSRQLVEHAEQVAQTIQAVVFQDLLNASIRQAEACNAARQSAALVATAKAMADMAGQNKGKGSSTGAKPYPARVDRQKLTGEAAQWAQKTGHAMLMSCSWLDIREPYSIDYRLTGSKQVS